MLGLVHQLSQISGARFASFLYRSKGTGQLSRYTVILGADVEKIYRDDAEFLTNLLPTLTDELDRKACEQLLSSVRESLEKGIGNNSRYVHSAENADTYKTFPSVPGLKIHKDTGTLHMLCLIHTKVVVEEGEYKKVNSRPLTIAKNKIRKQLRQSKIRQFAFSGIDTAKLNGETIHLS